MKNVNKALKVCIAIMVAIVVAYFGWMCLKGYKDAHDLDSTITYLDQFVNNFKSDKGILISILALAGLLVTPFATRLIK